MAYTKQNFTDGSILNASQLNHIEDGVYTNDATISNHSNLITSQSEEIAQLKDDIKDTSDSLAELKEHTEKEFGDIWKTIHDEHPNDFKEIQRIVQNGDADKVFNIGDQIEVPWIDTAVGTTYSMPFDIVAFRDVELEDGTTTHGMILQAHYAHPFGVQFSGNNALYVAKDAPLPAGTYCFTIGTTWGNNCKAGDVYHFTTTQEIPVGGQILIGLASSTTGACPDQNPENWKIYTYTDNTATTQLEKLDLATGAGGTSLGTTTSSIKIADNSKINNLQRASYGYNRWSQSAIRQYLNSSDQKNEWWSPCHEFDRPPVELTSKDGFMKGFTDDFLSILKPIKVQTACNYITDGGTSSNPVIDTTYDTFFLTSLEEEYIVPQVRGVEGASYPYWIERLPSEHPTGSSYTWEEHKRYALNSKTSTQYVRLRSVSRTSACFTWNVYSTGYVTYYNVTYSFHFAPACVIC